MGEFADMNLDFQSQSMKNLLDYRLGNISQEDAYDRGIINEYGGEPRYKRSKKDLYNHMASVHLDFSRPKPKTCRCCGETDLHWEEDEGKWRLFNERDEIHQCKVNPLSGQ